MLAAMSDEGGAAVAVEEVFSPSAEVLEAMWRLIPQLSSSAAPLTEESLEALVTSPGTRLLVASVPGSGAAGRREIVGTLTLVLYRIPTGVRAVIDDVVVDREGRGRGVGSALVREALRIAGAAGARHVDLTSRPDRVEANRLYVALGFEQRETNVYRYAGAL
jgi:ribosomal protein S18 acetylase RimI-like enzyme